ncbi:MAG: cyclic nucleotide-binding domain-containing protein [Alcanivoracaceae bacterium]|jgi:CRP-like cAMP-binding protein|nr:cyclic nucleotide-binding domain-containing protein [Alcanivoracaceae bacterium]
MGQGSIDKSLLQTFVPVNALTGEQLDRLLDVQEIRHYAAGDVLFERGDRDGWTIYLLKGNVQLDDGSGHLEQVGAGDIESWHPLDPGQPRRTRAVALDEVAVLCFDSAVLDQILAWDQSAGYVILDINSNAAYQDDRHWMIRLLKSRLFYRVPPGNILEIFRRLKLMRLKAGDVVINQGDDADCCYIIKDGMCEVLVKAEGATEAMPVAILEQGQWFGEDALLSGKPRNATVTMATDGVLMRLDRKDFDELLREPSVRTVGLEEAQKLVADGGRWLDVRTPDEFEQVHLRGALNMPLNVLRLKSRLLDTSRTYVAVCDTSRRSASAAFLLGNAGLDVYVLEGGLNEHADAMREALAD